MFSAARFARTTSKVSGVCRASAAVGVEGGDDACLRATTRLARSIGRANDARISLRAFCSRLSSGKCPAVDYTSRVQKDDPMNRAFCIVAALAIAFGAFTASARAQGFRFSNETDNRQAEEAQRQERVRTLLATPCLAKIKNQKIMVVIGENRNGMVLARQSAYDPHFEAINSRLRNLGLRTYTPEEIRSQVAQAEIDAFFRNDPDAAISASRRLAAQYILRGLIDTQMMRNPVINVNQVIVRLDFVLTGSNGRTISQAQAVNESFAGRDVLGMAKTLLDERAEEVVAQLYSDYCRSAGIK